MTTEKSKILVIGGTGYIGKFIVEGSMKAGNRTFALVREASLSDPVKGKTVQSFKDLGVTILHGDLNDHENICSASLYLRTLVHHVKLQPGLFTSPPRDKVTILGDGNAKVVINEEEDIAAYTIRTVDDPRTLDKTLYINPPKNILSMNEIVALWENKIGKSLEKTYMSEEQILETIQESPLSVFLSINHAVFVKGDQTSFTIEPSFGLEASELYPDLKYTSIDEYLSQFS